MAAANEGVDTMSAFQANMRTLLQEGTCSDVTLQVGGDSASAQQEVTLIKAHSNVLCAHSPVFALELASTWKDRVAASVSGVATVADVKVPYTLGATKVALDFCYSGAVEIPAGEVVEVLDLARNAWADAPSLAHARSFHGAAVARRSSAVHLIATKALRCTATAWNLTVAESFAKF